MAITRQADDGAGNRSTGSASNGGDERRAHGVIGKTVCGLLMLGPFAVVFGAYSTLVEYLPEQLFNQAWVKYAFAAAFAAAIGLALYVLGQTNSVRAFVERRARASSVDMPRQRSDASRRPGRVAPSETSSIGHILDGTRRRLVSDFQDVSTDGAAKAGWSQMFGAAMDPGVVGTAFCVRLALALDITDPSIDRAAVLSSIIAAQRPGGGWSGRTQAAVARPEVTAWVLDAAVPIGLEPGLRQQLVELLEQLMDPTADKEDNEHVTVVSSVVETLCRLKPSSKVLPALASRLVDSATLLPGADREAYWGRLLSRGTTPSVPHTARAVVALRSVAKVLPRSNKSVESQIVDTADAGEAWLERHFDPRLDDERLRRSRDKSSGSTGDELMVVQHFTAAWVARALLESGDVTGRRLDLLRVAVREVVASQKNGVWTWRGTDSEPTWMSYQGALVLRDYALRSLAWPP